MLRWTSSGAVSEPTAVQIRVSPAFQGRLRAGAPVPLRCMEPDEVRENLAWFARDRVGPRTPACTTAVLSGIAEPGAYVEVVEYARTLGVERVVWHLGSGAVQDGLAEHVDTLVRVARGPWDLSETTLGVTAALQVVVPLERGVLPGLDKLAHWLIDRAPERVVFQWPFPGSGSVPPPADEAARMVRTAVALLASADVEVGVKGIPPCVLAPGPVLGRWSERAWRSSNRWYVDADHQKEQALVFFPDLVRLTKVDGCRFCAAAAQCEGVVEEWLLQGLTGVLSPLGGEGLE